MLKAIDTRIVGRLTPLVPSGTNRLTVQHCASDGSALYASGGSTTGPGTPARELYKSLNGTDFTLVHDFGQRSQGPAPDALHNEIIYGIVEIPGTKTLVVSCVSNAWDFTSHGTMYRGVATADPYVYNWTRVSFVGDDLHNFLFVAGFANTWNLDANANYAVAGTYGIRDDAGNQSIHRDVWISTDDGAHWSRCFHIEGTATGDIDALGTHIHMTRIDPDGGCWVSVGDHNSGWNHANATLGLWHSPAQPAGGIAVGAHNFGDFTRVYSHATEQARLADGVYHRVRPVTCLFDGGYIYCGEDDMLQAEARTITRIKYSDGSYLPEILLNNTQAFTDAHPKFNGPIFGAAKLTADIWIMHSPAAGLTGAGIAPYQSTAYNAITYDGGETWAIVATTKSVKGLCRAPLAADGRVYGGVAYDASGASFGLS